MEKQIKELRVKIDGLSQLVKELKTVHTLDLSLIPEHWELEKWMEYIKASGLDKFKSPYPKSQELQKSYDSLILAKAWLGKILECLGTESPYKAGYKTVEDIEPTADVAKTIPGLTKTFNNKQVNPTIDSWELNGRSMTDYDNKSHIEKVDWLRTEISKLKPQVVIDLALVPKNISAEEFLSTPENKLIEKSLSKCKEYLIEARFWLGFELSRLRDEK